MNDLQAKMTPAEVLREKGNREELVARIAQAIPNDGSIEPVKGLRLNRSATVTDLTYGVTQPSFCVIAQGAKEINLGEEYYRYDPYHYLLATVELPAVSPPERVLLQHHGAFGADVHDHGGAFPGDLDDGRFADILSESIERQAER